MLYHKDEEAFPFGPHLPEKATVGRNIIPVKPEDFRITTSSLKDMYRAGLKSKGAAGMGLGRRRHYIQCSPLV